MSVSWHNSDRGPRVIIEMFGEEFQITVTRARGLRDDLTRVLDELDRITAERAVKP